MDHSGAPVLCGGERDPKRPQLHALPSLEFLHAIEAESLDKTADMLGDDDRLVGGNRSEGFFVEMIEVGVAHQDEIDRGEFMDLQAGFLQTLDDLEPLGPIGINEDGMLGSLNQEGGVTDPGDGNLAPVQNGERR
jgi:hypothetical protein